MRPGDATIAKASISEKLFLVWTFVLIGRPQDYFRFLEPLRIVLVFMVLSVLGILLSGRLNIGGLFVRRESKLYAVFFLIMIIGIPFAYYRRIAFGFVFQSFLTNFIYYYSVLHHVDDLERWRRMQKLLMACALFYGLFSILSGNLQQGRFFTYGQMYDPNDIAFVLIALMPVCLFFLWKYRSWFSFTAALTALICGFAVILLSGSRGGLISLAVFIVSLLYLFRKSIGFRHVLALSVIALIVLFFFGGNINTERYMSLENLQKDYNITSEGGRLQIWQRGWTLFLSNPITGVGATCFPMAIGYLREEMNVIPEWQAAHNSYLQVMVETGIFGILVFLLLLFLCWRNFKIVAKSHAQDGPGKSDLMDSARFLEAGTISLVVVVFFISQAYSPLITLYLALSSALVQIGIGNNPVKHSGTA
jgi:O-antigen ligase